MNVKNISTVLAITAGIGLASCSNAGKGFGNIINTDQVNYPAELPDATAYAEWKNHEPNLANKQVMQELTFTLNYQPAEWMALKSLGPGAGTQELMTETEQYSDLLYFNVRLQLNEAQTELLKYKLNDQQQYSQRIQYYAFKVQNDISLVVDEKDTIRCGISHFERTYSMTNYTDLLLGFSKKDLDADPDWKKLTLVFRDRVFGQGTIRFQFDRKQLTNTPKITGS